ncbi:MAG: phage antirepressor KilAC domain-containing protein [Coriobacteriaceae bacterium]|nr:phage antirepressor KilAC domain-containing protein [Coriobacteriaceae bacterium]
MSNEIVPQVFSSQEFGAIRAMRGEGGEPWFVASDIAKALGYGDATHMTRRLDDDEKGLRLVETPGGEQQMTVITEAGMYSAILGSKVEGAKRFKRWVTHEVLPAIRRHGAYATPEMVARSLRDPAVLIEVLDELRAEQLRSSELAEANQALTEENAAMRPKALFADTVAASDGTCLIGELAKMMTQAGFVIGQNRLFALLREDGFLGKGGSNRNVPLQRYVEMGLFKIKETAITHADGHVTINRTPKVTGKGQRYFIERYCGREVA